MLRPSSPPLRGRASPRGEALDISCAPHSSPSGDTFPPGGRLYQRHVFEISNDMQQSVTKQAMPVPPGGSHEVADNFFRKATFDKQLENKLRPSSVCYRRHLPPKGKAFFVTKYLNSCKIVRKQLTNAVFFAKIFSVSVRKRHSYALYADFCGLFSCFFMRNPEKNRFFIFAFFNCVRAIFRKIFYNFTRRLNLCLLSISSSKRAERKSLSNRRVLFSITAPRNAAYVCP